MLIKIPVYVDLDANLDPTDTQLLIQELSEEMSKSLRRSNGTGRFTIATDSFENVEMRILTRTMAAKEIKKSLGGTR